MLNYEEYDFEDNDEYSDDYNDLDEFDAKQADEADQYFRWRSTGCTAVAIVEDVGRCRAFHSKSD